MPLVAAFGPALVGSIHAAKHAALHGVAAFADIGYGLSSASLAAVLVRLAWKRTPDWIKEDVSFRNLTSSNNNNNGQPQTTADEGDLTNLSSVIEKLQALVDVGSTKLENPVPQLHAALLAYVQLSAQLKEQQQQQQQTTTMAQSENDEIERVDERIVDDQILTRDYLYKSAGEALSQKPSFASSDEGGDHRKNATLPSHIATAGTEHGLLQSALQYATWAYYLTNNTDRSTSMTTAAAGSSSGSSNSSGGDPQDPDMLDILRTKLEKEDFFLLERSLASRPGHVAYYVAVSPERKQVLVGLRGTSSLEDLLTDCCGRAVPLDDERESHNCDKARIEVRAATPNKICHTRGQDESVEVLSGHERIWVEDHDEDGDHYIRCHEGILLSSKRVADKIQATVEQLVIGSNYQLVMCGHSLGAGAASLVAVILRSRLPALTRNASCPTQTSNNSSNGNDNRMRVFCFAPPPVLDHDTALASASYCTSVINNADIIPRSSLANLLVFLEFLRAIRARLQEREMNPTGPVATASFLEQLLLGKKGELLMTAEEVRDAMNAAHSKVELRNPDHLYPPGRVLLAYRPWGQRRSKRIVSKYDTEEVEEQEDFTDDSKEDSQYQYQCRVTDGTATVLRFFEIDGPKMFTDHMTSSYFEALGLEYKY